MGAGRRRQGRKAASQPRPASRTRLVGRRRLDPGRHRRDPDGHAAWIAEGAAALARLYQHHRECHEHGAARLPQREAMALGLDGDALDRSRYEGSRQRLSTTEGSQATSSLTCRSARTPEQKLTRRPCSPSQRRLTLISAATASQCSTMSGTSSVLCPTLGSYHLLLRKRVQRQGRSASGLSKVATYSMFQRG